jgi:replicative DNA helicase
MSSARFTTGAALLEAWEHDLWHGEPPERWPLGPGALATDIDFGPGEVLLIGGAPGAGKTAFATGAVFDALRAVPDLKALICNVEMTPEALLNRQLARLSGVNLRTIQNREVGDLWRPGQESIRKAIESMRALLPRVAFLGLPYSLAHAAEAADEFGARCILLDYIQRIAAPGVQASQRESIEAAMGCIRNMAQAGAGVLVLSAVARQKGASGSNYSGLNLASFRGSSELEFAADSVYALSKDDKTEAVVLHACKRRNGETRDIRLRFERDLQRFVPEGMGDPERAYVPDPNRDMQAIADALDDADDIF